MLSQRSDNTKSWAVACALTGLAPVCGFVASLLTDFGRHAEPAVFEACAQMAPVLALALFAEIGFAMPAVVKHQGLTSANQATVRALVRSTIGLLLVSAGASLYAVGADVQTTMLVVMAVGPFAIQLFLLADAAYLRLDAGRVRVG